MLKVKPFVGAPLNMGLFVLVTQLLIWIAADALFGQYAVQVKEVLLIYFIALLISMFGAMAAGKPNILRISGDRETLTNFLLGFMGTSAFLMVLVGAGGAFGQLFTQAAVDIPLGVLTVTGISFGIYHGLVKAYVEEVIFRQILPRMLGVGAITKRTIFGIFRFGDLFSNILFAAFHLAVLTGPLGLTLAQSMAPLLLLFMLGMAWSKLRDVIGIAGSTGSHLAYNLFALGILGSVFMGFI